MNFAKRPPHRCLELHSENRHDVEKNQVKGFLKSLSMDIPLSECHPEAKKFRQNYKLNKEILCAQLFQLFDKFVFNSKLTYRVEIEWGSRMTVTAGLTEFFYLKTTCPHNRKKRVRYCKIALATKVLDSPERLRDTLIHEMCHAATWIISRSEESHGSIWKKWAKKAFCDFPELPPICIYHDYKVNTKYRYVCSKCSYSIGRHTKSLDTKTRRCECGGRFELHMTKLNR